MNNDTHVESWLNFVSKVADMFNQGISEQEISQVFTGSKVTWTGKVADIQLEADYSPGVAANMEPTHVKLKNNKVLRCAYLFLHVPAEKSAQWSSCNVSDTVRFTGVISKTYGPIPEIRLSVDESDPEVLLMMGLYDCEFIEKM